MDIEVSWGGAGLMCLARHDIAWRRREWQTADEARAGSRQRAAVLPHVIHMRTSHAVVGREDVRDTIGTDRNLKKVCQRSVATEETEQAIDANTALVNRMVAGLANSKDGLATASVKRLRKHHLPIRAGWYRGGTAIDRAAAGDERRANRICLVPRDVDPAVVAGGDARENRCSDARANLPWAIEV